MPLVPASLASSLQNNWLVPDGGSFPGSPAESGDKFAAAVSSWFAGATAAGFPCATAAARRSQLAASATGAFAAMGAPTAGALLALGVMGYMAGQMFGAGVSAPPTATGAAQAEFVATFLDTGAPRQARANRMATAIYTMALSTIVVFPPVISPPVPLL
jgi:hypothetical protein